MLTRATIRSTSEMFWAAAGGRNAYRSPVRIDAAVVRALPVAIHRVPGLTTKHVASILSRTGVRGAFESTVRALRGCLVADVGVGLILVDSDDPEAEQRVTVAHEIAHFLLHYVARVFPVEVRESGEGGEIS